MKLTNKDFIDPIMRICDYNRFDPIRSSAIVSDVKRYASKIAGFFGYTVAVYKGIGGLPLCPWFGFLRGNNTPQRGFYIVFLFDNYFMNVYMTVAFGTSFYNYKQVDAITAQARELLSIDKDHVVPVKLFFDSTNPKKYEKSSIFAYKYDISQIHSYHIVEDFYNIVSLYDEIYSKEPSEVLRVGELHQQIKSQMRSSYSTYDPTSSPRSKEEMIIVNKLLKEIGDEGEKIALDLLSQQYTNITHTALLNENAGYDIEVQELDANGTVHSRYYEIKTTVNGVKTPFFMSDSELRFAQNHMNEYYVIRLYKLDRSTNPSTYKSKIFNYTQLMNDWNFVSKNYKVIHK